MSSGDSDVILSTATSLEHYIQAQQINIHALMILALYRIS